jgi:hypothetical protein
LDAEAEAKPSIIISSPSTSVRIRAAFEVPSKAAVTPDVPATLLIAFFSAVRSLADVTVAEIEAAALPVSEKVTTPVPTELNLRLVTAVAVTPVLEVAALTLVATVFTESAAVIVIVEAPLLPVRLKVVVSSVSVAVVDAAAAKAVPSMRFEPIEAAFIDPILVEIW